MALFLLAPSFALAEGDYEQGDGWIYQDGELTILANDGLINFLYHEEEMLADPNHQHNAEDVDRVVIGKDVTDIVIDYYIGDYHPSNTTVEEGNKSFIIDNGWVVNKETNTLFGAANVKQNQTRTVIDDIPTYIEHIGMYAFSDCFELKRITIPDGVISIGESAFQTCHGLATIHLPAATTSIGISAFNGCTALTRIDFFGNINYIGIAAFDACFHLETPPLYNTKIEVVYGNSFWGCDQFRVVELPTTLKEIKSIAFMLCDNLNTLIIQSNQLVIESGAFEYCKNVRKLVFTKGKPASIGDSLFGETEKTPDGKSFITRFYDLDGEVIPYPTLFYTAAYADEWAPNGETEWNGYPIEEISQNELNAILAEARGEPAPTVSAPVATASFDNVEPTSDAAAATAAAPLGEALLAALMMAIVAGIVVVVVIARKRRE